MLVKARIIQGYNWSVLSDAQDYNDNIKLPDNILHFLHGTWLSHQICQRVAINHRHVHNVSHNGKPWMSRFIKINQEFVKQKKMVVKLRKTSKKAAKYLQSIGVAVRAHFIIQICTWSASNSHRLPRKHYASLLIKFGVKLKTTYTVTYFVEIPN